MEMIDLRQTSAQLRCPATMPRTRACKGDEEMKPLGEYIKEVEKMGRPEFLIQELLLPQRYLVLVGRTGIGKSLLATQLVFCLASGEPWIGFKVKPCQVVYINLELTDFQLGERLKMQAKNFKLIHEPVIESRPFQLMEKTELKAIMTASPKPEMVIIDSFRHVYKGKMNDNDLQSKWVDEIQALEAEYNLGVVVVQNTGKAKPLLDAGSVEESIGASELTNRAVSVMVATAHQERVAHGHFGSKASDKVELSIPKYGCSTIQLGTIPLLLNRETLLFEKASS